MKRGFGLGSLFCLLLLIAAAGFLIAELLQRHRYNSTESRLEAALTEFKARCFMTMTEHHELTAAVEGTRNPWQVVIKSDTEDPPNRYRNKSWSLDAGRSDPAMTERARMLLIILLQRRTFFLRSPEVHLLGRPHPSVKKLLDDILLQHGLTYSETMPPD